VVNIRVRIRVRDGARISNRVRERVKLVNYSLITALPIATSSDLLFACGLLMQRVRKKGTKLYS